MRYLPLIALFSILSVVQARNTIRRQIRKRNTISEGLDTIGIVRTAGSGSFGVVTQTFHTFSNVLDKVDASTKSGQDKPVNLQAAPKSGLDSAGTGNTATTSTSSTGSGAVNGKTGSLAARDGTGRTKKDAAFNLL